MDYQEAQERLKHKGHGHEMSRRKLQNNTYLERLGEGEIGLLLHNTYIARFMSDGSVILDTGGWRTVTTKDRFSWVSQWRVFSAKQHRRAESHWWLSYRYYYINDMSQWVPFFDGVHVHQHTGEVLSADEEIEWELKERDPGPGLRDKVTEYLTLFTEPEKMAKVVESGPSTQGPANDAQMAHAILEEQYVDLSVIYSALRVDAARRGELHRSPEKEALEWLDLLAEGKEPPRVRSIIRNFVYYLEKS